MDFNMMLRTKEQWTELFISFHIPADIAKVSANKFILNCIAELNFPDLTKDDLQELSITTFGDIKNILRKQVTLTSPTTQSDTNPPTSSSFMKTPAAKLSQLTQPSQNIGGHH